MNNAKQLWTHPIVLHSFLSVLLVLFIARPIIIPTDSMENTINEPSVVMGFNANNTTLKRGSIIGFDFNEGSKKQIYIKRIIGLPGDTVQINGDTVTVNGKVLKESYLPEPMNPYKYNDGDAYWYEKGVSENGLHFYDFDGNEIVWKYSAAEDESDKECNYAKDQVYNRTFEVPQDSYFCLGDNRNYSYDARFWDNPYVNEKDIRYLIIMQVYPLKIYGKGDFE